LFGSKQEKRRDSNNVASRKLHQEEQIWVEVIKQIY
jgi:hypothetical protein